MFDIILDRDGTLNIDTGYAYRLEECVLTHGAVNALLALQKLGARFSIATHQAGIARGKYTEVDMQAFNAKLCEPFAKQGIQFAAVAFCPHHPSVSECECRKPKLGLLRRIEEKIGPIDWSRAWGIGDKTIDAEMILAMGGRSVLLRSGPHNNTTGQSYWDEKDPALSVLLHNPRNFIVESLPEAARIIAEHI